MHKPGWQNIYRFSLLFLFAMYSVMVSCVSVKKAKYFSDLPDTMSSPIIIDPTSTYVDPKIESNDNLSITVQTVTQNAGNSPISSNSLGTFNPLSGYLVDKNGYVEISVIGFVKVGGLTTSEARELIKQKAKEFYNNPVVNVRIANFEIQMLGDVNRPGPINVPNEKVSILDAIAISGDLPLSAKKDNILLIRTEGNEKKFVRLNLNSSDIFKSPYFYLKQHDVIYVEPNKFKVQNSDGTFIRNLGVVSSIISLASLVLLFKSIK